MKLRMIGTEPITDFFFSNCNISIISKSVSEGGSVSSIRYEVIVEIHKVALLLSVLNQCFEHDSQRTLLFQESGIGSRIVKASSGYIYPSNES